MTDSPGSTGPSNTICGRAVARTSCPLSSSASPVLAAAAGWLRLRGQEEDRLCTRLSILAALWCWLLAPGCSQAQPSSSAPGRATRPRDPASAGRAAARCGGPAVRARSGTRRQRQGAPRHHRHRLRGPTARCRSARLGAARVVLGPDGRRLDHRRRAECDRPIRPRRPRRSRCGSCPRTAATPTSTRHLRQGRHAVVHRPDRHLRQGPPETREVTVWRDPEGRGPYGIDQTPTGEIWYVSLAGSHLSKVNSPTAR
jgi:hypothetical protein